MNKAEREKKYQEAAIAFARGHYCNDDVEIDDTPALSKADNGTWVAAWVWVSNEDLKTRRAAK